MVTPISHAVGNDRSDVSIYVLNMGQPVKIVDLAERMIRLMGLEPGRDIDIVFSGIRPGERLNEILFAAEEPSAEIGIPGIVAARPTRPPLEILRAQLGDLAKAVVDNDHDAAFRVLQWSKPQARQVSGSRPLSI